MSVTSTEDLRSFALDAAREIAGVDAIGDVEIGETFFVDEAAVKFTYLFHRDRSRIDPGTARLKLAVRLHDELERRGEPEIPHMVMLDQHDWDQRRRD